MKKILMGIVVVIVIAVGFIYICTQFLSGSESSYYYTQIDNSKIEKGDSRGGVIDTQGGMEYYYTLPAYDEKGDEKEITFGASRELREAAFIRLTTAPVRGVIEWREVQYEEMPVVVQGKFEDVVED